jgi:maleylpyruvate isomerase
MKLYTYFRSSAAYRVRIALNLKGLEYEAVPVHLLRDGGEHRKEAYTNLNPSALLPALEDNGVLMTQSLAIIEYLEETHPMVPLLPQDAVGRARVRALSQTIACDTHPLTNLRVLKHLKGPLGFSEEAKMEWWKHWNILGMQDLEAHLDRDGDMGRFCYGDTPTMADCLLVPQVFNAKRFELDMSQFPNISRIADHCENLPAFVAAHPSNQPDTEV